MYENNARCGVLLTSHRKDLVYQRYGAIEAGVRGVGARHRAIYRQAAAGQNTGT